MEQLIANILVLASRYALTTLGLSLIYRSAGYFDFGQGAMFVIGAYGAFVCTSIFRLPLVAAIIIGALLAGCLGGLVDQAIYRPLRHRHCHAFAIILASLGLLIISENGIALIFSDVARSLPSGDPKPGNVILGARITDPQIVIMAATLGASAVMFLALRLSRIGLYLRALGSDRMLLQSLGSPIERLLVTSATVGSLLSGLAGGLSALELDVHPMAGNEALLPAILLTLLGGAGSVWGTLLAALIMATLEGLAGSYVSLLWREAIAYVVVLLILFVRPQGLLGASELPTL